MNRFRRIARAITVTSMLCCAAACSSPRAIVTQPKAKVEMSVWDKLLGGIDKPGTVEVQTIIAGDWESNLSGLLDLTAPQSVAARLTDKPTPIYVYFHALRHPEAGLYLVDTGVEQRMVDALAQAAFRGAGTEHYHTIKVRKTTAAWLAEQKDPVKGVFFTHIHPDHVLGLGDIPRSARLFAGEGESLADVREALRPSYARSFEGFAPIEYLAFAAASRVGSPPAVDIFGDEMVFAIHVPGHTPGSTAYVVRSPQGPVLLVGDVCPTAWGWKHQVPPGSYSVDRARNAESLRLLKGLVEAHPSIQVRLGHQAL